MYSVDMSSAVLIPSEAKQTASRLPVAEIIALSVAVNQHLCRDESLTSTQAAAWLGTPRMRRAQSITYIQSSADSGRYHLSEGDVDIKIDGKIVASMSPESMPMYDMGSNNYVTSELPMAKSKQQRVQSRWRISGTQRRRNLPRFDYEI